MGKKILKNFSCVAIIAASLFGGTLTFATESSVAPVICYCNIFGNCRVTGTTGLVCGSGTITEPNVDCIKYDDSCDIVGD